MANWQQCTLVALQRVDLIHLRIEENFWKNFKEPGNNTQDCQILEMLIAKINY